MHPDSSKIRDLNDRFRGGDQNVPGDVFFTAGICDLIGNDTAVAAELLARVRSFDTFTKDNDPWGEHDFGAFEFREQKCFWKIDVFDPSLEAAPLDATDVTLSRRVLTIMTASEY